MNYNRQFTPFEQSLLKMAAALEKDKPNQSIVEDWLLEMKDLLDKSVITPETMRAYLMLLKRYELLSTLYAANHSAAQINEPLAQITTNENWPLADASRGEWETYSPTTGQVSVHPENDRNVSTPYTIRTYGPISQKAWDARLAEREPKID